MLKVVQRSDKINSRKSSEIIKKSSNETTKFILKSRLKLQKTVQRNDKIYSQKLSEIAKNVQLSDKIYSQKSSENAKICPLNIVVTLHTTKKYCGWWGL